MIWPGPRLTLCSLILISCEFPASSFGFGAAPPFSLSRRSSVECKRGPRRTSGCTSRIQLGMVGGDANENDSIQGSGSGGTRKREPAVQAVAEKDTMPPFAFRSLANEADFPDDVEEKDSELNGEGSMGASPFSSPLDLPGGPPSTMRSLRDGVNMELGEYKAEPFEVGSFPAPYLYALQRLRSEEDKSFGAAFISLRAGRDRASTRTWNVGRPNATAMMSLARFKLWWMMPKHSTKANEVPPETQMMLTKLPPDPTTGKQLYGLFIPLIDGQAKCSLKGLPDGSLQLFAETGCSKTPVPSRDVAGLYVGVHEDPFKLVEKSFKLVSSRLRNQVKAGYFGAGGLVPGLIHDAEKQLSRWKKTEVITKSVDKTSPDFSNYLGWCTWDSFYTSVDHDKVFKGLESLREAGINPKWLVLDDGWQSTTNVDAANGEQWMDHLTSIMANRKFKNEKEGTDLSRTVKKARDEFGVEYFLVWHAIAGYWAGVDLDSPDLMKYRPRRATFNAPPGIVEVDPDMKMFFRVSKFLNKRFGIVPPDKIRAFYDDYHRYLKSQGVHGVKVDAQSVVNFIGPGNGGSVMLTRAFHSALSKSVRKHFRDTDGEKGEGGRIIHCMCHDSEILLQLPACYGRQPLIRGSDDFYPRDTASHAPHIYANVFNGLMISSCGLQDWDMFQTNIGEASWMHASSRAISGGPVYISDRPGEHNTKILRRIVLEDGSVLKPPSNALPCLKSLFVDPQRDPDSLLYIWNECGTPGHGVVGAYNVYGSAWSQTRRTYAPVRTPSAVRKESNGANAKNGDGAGRVLGGVKASDCHSLLREHDAEGGEASLEGAASGVTASAGLNGSAKPRYAIHFHFGDRLVVGGLHEEIPLALERGGSEVAAISKVLAIDALSGRGEWASIGLVDMFNAGGAIAAEEITKASGDATGADGVAGAVKADLLIKGSGRFVALCSLRPAGVLFDGQPIEFSHAQNSGGVPFLEVVLPEGYAGSPRRLVVQWNALRE